MSQIRWIRVWASTMMLMVFPLLCDIAYAGSGACPVAFMGQWSGRHNYYCFSGVAGNDCAGTPVAGSDVRAHNLGCSNYACLDPIGTAAVRPVTEIHLQDARRPFEGADALTPTHSSDVNVHSHFNYAVQVEGKGPIRVCRVVLLTHDKMTQSGCCGLTNPIPKTISQEVKVGGEAAKETPVNDGSPVAATMYLSESNIVKFNVPARFFKMNWKSSDTELQNWFGGTADLEVVAILIP